MIFWQSLIRVILNPEFFFAYLDEALAGGRFPKSMTFLLLPIKLSLFYKLWSHHGQPNIFDACYSWGTAAKENIEKLLQTNKIYAHYICLITLYRLLLSS